MSFNNFIRDEDFGLDEPDLLTTLSLLTTDEQSGVLTSMQQVIEQSERIISCYSGKTA